MKKYKSYEGRMLDMQGPFGVLAGRCPDEQVIEEFRRVRDEIRSEMSKISPR